MPVLESNLHGLWMAAQTAKGTAGASASARRMRIVAGDVNTDREDGSENFSDGDRFGSAQDYVNQIMGSGDPGIQAQPSRLAYLCWLFFGQETVTGSADPWTHEFTPGASGSKYATIWKYIGSTVNSRQKFLDCKLGQLQIEGSTGQKVVRATPTIMSLDPGEIYATDPVGALEAQDAFLYTEGEGAFEIDDVVIRGQSQFQCVWNDDLDPAMGDSVVPIDLVSGNPTVTVTVTVMADSAGVQEYNKRIYGTASPAAGQKPIKGLPALGRYDFLLTKKDSAGAAVSPARDFKLEIPGVKWTPDVALPPNPDGGLIELSLTGQMRKVAGQPISKVTIRNGDAAYVAS